MSAEPLTGGMQGPVRQAKTGAGEGDETASRRGFFAGTVRFLSRYLWSTLTQRIVFLNIAGLVVLVSGILYLNQFRDSLIEARVESLLTQGEIIAGAIAAQAAVETNTITIDPERLLELQAGESTFPAEFEDYDFPINPEQVAPVLRRLISPTRTRARIFDRDGQIILDSLRLYSRGQILSYELPPVRDAAEEAGFWDRMDDHWTHFRNWLTRGDLPDYEEASDGDGTIYGEVVSALTGTPASKTRRTSEGDTIVSVAVPVQRFRAVLGVLLLSTEAGDIDKILADERSAIVRTFVVAASVMLILSLLLASTIARPLHRLSLAAERVRLGVKTREQIPDFSERQDEIGHLSKSLRDMTEALYGRIEAIERFAADVSHELKNPLTSLRSAVETLPLVKKEEQRQRLLDVIEHDVRRLDRLISDISDASRLDAELARDDTEVIDLSDLLVEVQSTYRSMAEASGADMPDVQVDMQTDNSPRRKRSDPLWDVLGHKGRLGQVLTNLIDNAKSFVPSDGGRIVLGLRGDHDDLILTVTDNGPGIPPENTTRVFERFYTDRPEGEAFGQNSGLGLSIVKQIVDAHGGSIRASNVVNDQGDRQGARFTVVLPRAKAE